MANLTQLRMLEELDGLLLVDKPAGIAFSSVVKTVKRKFNLVKVGHGGSLDAMASGLFVVLLGGANKFVGDIMGADRSYTGTMKFGETTDTGDRYGRPIPLPERVMKPEEAKGDLFQTEPRFCAVRREGSAQYDIADTGEHTQFLAHVYRFEVGEKDASSVSRACLPLRGRREGCVFGRVWLFARRLEGRDSPRARAGPRRDANVAAAHEDRQAFH